MENFEHRAEIKHSNLAGVNGDMKDENTPFAERQNHVRETLAKSQKRFRYAFLTSPDSVAIIRARDKSYTEINEMFSLFLGYKKDEIIGKSFLKIPAWH
ncbi:MAG: PAS domain S-box protein, partial [Deltaproteobacteria bacterium]|nr:PAS domain S-box protein [Deltaproteobacteria bacterium]